METKEEIEYSSTLVFTVLSTYYLWEKGCVQSAQGQECRYSTLAMNPLTCQLANVHPHDPTGYCWQLLPHSANWEQIALIEHRGQMVLRNCGEGSMDVSGDCRCCHVIGLGS